MSVRQSTLHVPRPLEDFVLAYTPDEDQYLFQAALPKKPVRFKADSIRQESKAALLQLKDLNIGPHGGFPQTNLVMGPSINYVTAPYGIEVPLYDDERASADSEVRYDQRQVKFGLVQIATQFEYVSIKQRLRTAASYGANTAALTAPRQWDNYASLKSDPFEDWLMICGVIENATTKRPNFVGLHARVWDVILNHPRVKGRAARENGQGASMTIELWERILRLKPGTVRLTTANYNLNTDISPAATPDYRSFIGPDVIFAMNEQGSVDSYGLGQTFWYTGDAQTGGGMSNYSTSGQDLRPAGDIVVRSYQAPWQGKGATMVKIYGEWSMQILNNQAGYLLQNAVNVNNPIFLDNMLNN